MRRAAARRSVAWSGLVSALLLVAGCAAAAPGAGKPAPPAPPALFTLSSVVRPTAPDVPPEVTIALYGAYDLPTTSAEEHHAHVVPWQPGATPAHTLVVTLGDVSRAATDIARHLDAGHAVLVFARPGEKMTTTWLRQMLERFDGRAGQTSEVPDDANLYGFYRPRSSLLQHDNLSDIVHDPRHVLDAAMILAHRMRPVTVATDRERTAEPLWENTTSVRADQVAGDALVLSWEHAQQFREMVQAYLYSGRPVGIYREEGLGRAEFVELLSPFGYASNLCERWHCHGTEITLFRDTPDERVQFMPPFTPPNGDDPYVYSVRMAVAILRDKPTRT